MEKACFTTELAPMEGITTYIYRNALNKHFGGIDVYYSPFIETHKNKEMSYKEINDIKPENNVGMNFIPQILTNDAESFHITTKKIAQYGYDRFNLNLGCPSGTVTTKNRGAGMLKNPQDLDRLLDGIFSKTDYKISIKTRIGYEFETEWEDILDVYGRYPIDRLIIHPRVREDYYKGKPRLEAVTLAFDKLQNKMPIVYNGDVYSIDDFNKVSSRFTQLSGIMMGRGMITNPGLGQAIKAYSDGNSENGKLCISDNAEFRKKFKAFHNELLEEYIGIMPGDKPVLFKMKELWSYMYVLLENPEKGLKKIRKCESCSAYKAVVNSLL